MGKYSLQWVALWFWDESSNWKAPGCLLYGKAGKVPSSVHCSADALLGCRRTASLFPAAQWVCGSREAQEPPGRRCLRAPEPCRATTLTALPHPPLPAERTLTVTELCGFLRCCECLCWGFSLSLFPWLCLYTVQNWAQQGNADHTKTEGKDQLPQPVGHCGTQLLFFAKWVYFWGSCILSCHRNSLD